MEDTLQKRLNILKIIVLALIMGLTAFAVVTLFLVINGLMPQTSARGDMLWVVLAFLVIGQIPVYAVLRRGLIARLQRMDTSGMSREQTIEAFVGGYAILTVIGAALTEGPALFATVIVLVTGNLIGLALPALGVIMLAMQIPSRDKMRRFAERLMQPGDGSHFQPAA